MPLPFRSPNIRMPNNRPLAVNRLNGLLRTLKRKPKMKEDYFQFMSKVFEAWPCSSGSSRGDVKLAVKPPERAQSAHFTSRPDARRHQGGPPMVPVSSEEIRPNPCCIRLVSRVSGYLPQQRATPRTRLNE